MVSSTVSEMAGNVIAGWRSLKFKYMDEIERKTMQDIKDYVKSLDRHDNEVYQQNSLLIMSCFSKAIEFIEQNSKLRQPLVSGECEHPYHSVLGDGEMQPAKCLKCGKVL
jgi:hypothetical protein